METINLTCIGCPMGCPLTVTMENGEVKDVKLMLYLLKQNQIFQKAKSLMYVVH